MLLRIYGSDRLVIDLMLVALLREIDLWFLFEHPGQSEFGSSHKILQPILFLDGDEEILDGARVVGFGQHFQEITYFEEVLLSHFLLAKYVLIDDLFGE